MKKLLLLAALAVPLVACADMTPTQQRALTGTAAGAGVGAVFGAIGGNAGLGAAAGAGAGLVGGLLVDRSRQAQDRAFQEGVAAGRQGR
jgi:Glycine-zipper domain